MASIKHKYLCFVFISILSVVLCMGAPKVYAATQISGEIQGEVTWTLEESPYVVNIGTTIPAGSSLNIEPGVVVKFPSSFASLDIDGELNAIGTVESPIIFTSYKDDNAGGDTNEDGESYPDGLDWRGIIFGPGSLGKISHASVLYGGQYIFSGDSFVSFPMIRQGGGDLTLENVELNPHSIQVDTLGQTNGNTTIVDSYIGVGQNGVVVSGGQFSIHDSKIEGWEYGLNNESENTIEAENNWWGDSSGPVHENNPDGEGVSVQGDVSFTPWLTHEPNTAIISLAASPEVGFSDDATNPGMEPNLGIAETTFTWKVVYTNSFNQAPESVRLVVNGYNEYFPCQAGGGGPNLSFFFAKTAHASEGDGCEMELDTDASEILRDGNYENGEQYILMQQFPDGNYTYRIEADGIEYPEGDEFSFKVGGEECAEDCFSNVLFLPGLQASRLYKQRSIIGEDQLWEPNVNSDVEALYLNTDGTSKNSDIYTRDIIKETNSPVSLGFAGQNIYKSFSNTMDDLVEDEKIAEWKPYAYDWRQSVEDIVNNGTDHETGKVSLIDTLQSLVDSSKSGKVTMVTHSNGGLLAKALLKKLQEDKTAGLSNLIDNVDVLILVAVPEIGTPKAVAGILHGYDQEILHGWILDEKRARELGRNMISAFGLLPSREYINRVSASPVTFKDNAIPSNISTKLVQAFGSAINSYTEYTSFLFGGEGRTNPISSQTNLPIILSEDLFNQAENLHDSIDAFTPPESLRVIEVAGWGLDTLASFEYYPKPSYCAPGSTGCSGFILDQEPRFTHDGDGTVVVPSAHYMSFLGSAEKYWVNLPRYNRILNFTVDRKHAGILEVDSLNNLIQSVIEDKDITFDDVLKNVQPIDDSDRIRLSIHSPVTLDAYDAEGNHTGKICPSDSEFCFIEENILNSSYMEFGEGKYINLPEDQLSKIKLQGTDIGTFTYKSEKVSPNGTSTVSSFVDIPVTTQTQAEIILNQTTQNPELKLDVTGDGVTDFTLLPNSTFDPITYLQIMKSTINSLDLPQARKTAFNNRVDNVIKSIQKGKIDKVKLKVDRFKSALERKLAKPDPKKPKPKKLSKTDAQLLLDMLNKLLDNIS